VLQCAVVFHLALWRVLHRPAEGAAVERSMTNQRCCCSDFAPVCLFKTDAWFLCLVVVLVVAVICMHTCPRGLCRVWIINSWDMSSFHGPGCCHRTLQAPPLCS
jgi:hypothetical protein